MSDLEDELAFQLKAAKIPFEREIRFHPKRRWRMDFVFPPHNLAMEVEGAVFVKGAHSTGVGITKDIEKGNAALLMGWKVLRATAAHVKSGQALEWVETMLEKERKH